MFENLNLEHYLDAIKDLDTIWIYAIIFLSGFLENCIPPIPGDMVTVFAATMVGMGRLNYFATFLIATAGNLSGFMTMYYVGRAFGKDFFIRRNFKFFSKESFEKTESWFHKHGYWLILFNRFLSGFRSVISIFAGMTHLQRTKIMPLAFLSACMWDGVLIYMGYVLGDNWKYFGEIMGRYNKIVFSILILAVIFIVGRKIYRYNKMKSETHEPQS